jgi:hypothetical protein
MSIKSFELVSLDAKRFTKLGERVPHLRVDQNISVNNISPSSDKEALISFAFTVSYAGVGMIKIEGRLTWEGEAKEIASQWANKKQLPQAVFNPIYAAIFSNCMPASVVVARDIGLPPPLPPPQIGMRKEAKMPGAKDHKSSMEVA